MGYGKSQMGGGEPPRSSKRVSGTNQDRGELPTMIGRMQSSDGGGLGMKTKFHTEGGGGVLPGSAKPAYGEKTTASASKLGTQGITTQGDRSSGMTAGRGRTNSGKNNIGASRFQTTRG